MFWDEAGSRLEFEVTVEQLESTTMTKPAISHRPRQTARDKMPKP